MKHNYYKYKVTNLIKIKNIVTMHNFNFDKNFVSFKEKHDFYEFVYCKKGPLIVSQDNIDILLKENEIIFHSPNVIHGVKTDGYNNASVYIVSFVSLSKQINYFNNKVMNVPSRLKTILNMIFEVGSETFDIDNSTPNTLKMELKEDAALGGIQSVTNLLEFFLIELIKSQGTENINFLINSNELIDQVISYLKDNVENKINIEDITNKFGYSKSLLFKEFKKATNNSIMSYYNKLKIDKAKYYLRKTNKSIGEITNILCFTDQNYFTKAFKKITGTTPRKYKYQYL